MDSSISMESKHLDSFTRADLYYFEGLQMCAQSSGALGKKLKDSLKACEVKKWAENENTARCQCFPNDYSVVWHWSRRLLGPGPTHLRLGSSLSNAIWTSEAIVSLMWQPKLGRFYLFSSGVKKEDRNITNTSWYVKKTCFLNEVSTANGLIVGRRFDIWHHPSSLISACVM